MGRATGFGAKFRTATGGGKAAFKKMAGRHRRLAIGTSSLATASDAEIEMLAGRIVGRSLPETDKEPDAAV